MAARANWKGYLKLSLVSCPVQLFPATATKERVSFHLLNRETGRRLKRKLVDPETDEAVDSEDQVKGFQVGKNEYVLVEEDEIEKVQIESNHTIDIETFVPRSEIDEAYLDTPYYLTPDGRIGEEAFAVIREAMKQKDVVGIGRVVLYRRERLVMLEPRGKGLAATTLRYAYEVRPDKDYFEEIGETEVPDELLDLATHIISRKLATFDPKRFEDRYQDALLALIKAKQQHEPVTAAMPAPKASNVVNLMDALRRSIETETKSTGEKSTGDNKTGATPKKEHAAPAEPKSAREARRSAERTAKPAAARLKKVG